MKAEIGTIYFVKFNYLKKTGRIVCSAVGC
jgi:hypothetical protein